MKKGREENVKKGKILLILPPEWIPSNPYLSPALLKAQLIKAGFDAHTLDLNIKFFNRILTRDHTKRMIEKGLAELSFLNGLDELKNASENELAFFDVELKTKYIRRRLLADYYSGGREKADEVAENIEASVAILKSDNDFYDPEKLFKAKGYVKQALKIVSLPYAPTEICYDNYYPNPLMGLDYEGITRQCVDESQNMFIEYFNDVLDETDLSEWDAVGISVVDLSQLIPAMTLGKMIKERAGNIHVSLGGNYITKTFENLDQQPGFFGLYADSLITGDGEISIVEWAQSIVGDRTQENVHSYTYFDGSKVVHTEHAPLLDLDAVAIPDFDDYDFAEYLTPRSDIIIPIQLSKGCYWGKCTFCDFFYGQQRFDIKSVASALAEIKNAVDKYGASKFTFVDEAVSPGYYRELSEAVLKEGLNINFYSFVRLENQFTPEVLKTMRAAGGCMFMWGYEACSKRIMKLINKGIDLDNRLIILKNSHEAGIWNHCTFLLGYPTETAEEINSTIDIIRNRTDIVNSCTPSNFSLKEKAMMIKNLSAFGMESAKKNGDFHISYSDVVSGGITMKERKEIRHDFQREYLKETARHLWTLTFYDIDHLFLYTARYPIDYVKDFRLSFDKDI